MTEHDRGRLSPGGRPVEVRRSARRRRTISARIEDGAIIVLVPAGMSRADEQRAVDDMVRRLERSRARTRKRSSDAELMRRARALSREFLDGRAEPESVRWVTNQNTRWGSCTPSRGTIRLSHRMQGMPQWVIDSVLLHELAHLVVPRAGHGPAFQELVRRYPMLDKADGYLLGVSHAKGLDISDDDISEDEPGDDEAAANGVDGTRDEAGDEGLCGVTEATDGDEDDWAQGAFALGP